MKTPQTVSNPAPQGYRGPEKHWDAYSTNLALRLHEEGKTGGQIAHALSEAGYPYSRSAVIGRLNRLGRIGRDTSPTMPTFSTGVVLGTFLENLCDIGSW